MHYTYILASPGILEDWIINSHVDTVVFLRDGDAASFLSLHLTLANHLVQEFLALEGSSNFQVLKGGDCKVRVKSSLEIPSLLTLVFDEHLSVELIVLDIN